MSLLSTAETALEVAVPEVRAARWGLKALGIALAAAAFAFVIWWVLVRPRAAQVEAATARVEAATSDATAGASRDTMGLTLDAARRRAAVDATTQENEHAIKAAPGAVDSIGADLDRAGRAALCMRDAYQSDPGCAALRRDGGGVGPALPDPGSFTPAR